MSCPYPPHPHPPSTVRHSRRSFRPEDVGRGWKTRPEDVETEGTTHGGRNMTTKGLTLMPWVSRSLRFSVLSAREHAIHPRSLPSGHRMAETDGGHWRWLTRRVAHSPHAHGFLSLVPFRPEERRNGWEEREALASLTPPCGANDMRPEWAKRERNVSEPFRRLSPLSARFLSSRSFHSLPEDVRAEERGEGQTTVGNEWEDERRTRRSDKVTNINIFKSYKGNLSKVGINNPVSDI